MVTDTEDIKKLLLELDFSQAVYSERGIRFAPDRTPLESELTFDFGNFTVEAIVLFNWNGARVKRIGGIQCAFDLSAAEFRKIRDASIDGTNAVVAAMLTEAIKSQKESKATDQIADKHASND